MSAIHWFLSNLANSPDVEWAAMRCVLTVAACFALIKAAGEVARSAGK